MQPRPSRVRHASTWRLSNSPPQPPVQPPPCGVTREPTFAVPVSVGAAVAVTLPCHGWLDAVYAVPPDETLAKKVVPTTVGPGSKT